MKQMDSVYGISLAVIYRDKLLILFVGFFFSQANSCRQQRQQYQIHCSEQIIQILAFGLLSQNVLLNCKTLTIVRLIIFIKWIGYRYGKRHKLTDCKCHNCIKHVLACLYQIFTYFSFYAFAPWKCAQFKLRHKIHSIAINFNHEKRIRTYVC